MMQRFGYRRQSLDIAGYDFLRFLPGRDIIKYIGHISEDPFPQVSVIRGPLTT